ncbi:sensor histidine kinase [Haloimpatiens sp. FM7315]|uniref:sensor histidine kinase n=1 Tax=Haloimpatiens sp. FM7315 TaxID=3298609 RepID=UPI0035A329D1
MMFQNLTFKLLEFMIVPSILMSILCCISIFILYNEQLKSRDIRRYFLISLAVGMVLYTGSYMIILPILTIITVIQLKEINKDRIKILITIYGVYFLNQIYTFTYVFLEDGLKSMNYKYTIVQFVLMGSILIILCFIMKKILNNKKYNKESSPSKVRYRLILLINIVLTLFIVFIYEFTVEFIINKQKMDFIMGNVTPSILPLISIILSSSIVYYYDKSVEYRVKLKRETEEKNEIEEYAHIIENMYSQTKRFKHDYINMLSPLKEYIDNADVKGLSKFFYENVIDMDKNINWSSSNIDKLKYIKVSGVKAIFSTKLIKAASMNIDISVEIVEDIECISMNIMDLCRIIGILMDNAIEGAQECEYPKLCLVVVNKNDYVRIVIRNNFFGDKPLIHKIFKEGFSTKGTERGLGLYTVKNIIDNNYNNVFLDTSIEDNVFVQELWIKHINK